MRTRILATMLVVAALGMTAAGLLTYQAQRAFVFEQIDHALRTQAGLAERAVEGSAVESVRDALERILSSTPAPQNGGSLGIVDGRAAYLPGLAESFRPEEVPGFLGVATLGEGARIDTFAAADVVVRYLVVPLSVAGDPERGAYVAAIDVSARLTGVDRSIGLYAVVSATVLLLTAVLGWFVAGSLLAPIRRLHETAERINLSALGERIPVEGRDDVSRLTATVNRMLDRIGDGVEQQRRLLADLRHQLRAPLTVVRGHLELVDPDDPGDVIATRRIALEEVDRMARMIDELARLVELGLPAADRVTVDAAALARELHERVRGLAGHEWVLGRADAVAVSVDHDRILEAWLQLADNASRYAPAATAIVIGAIAENGTVRLSVRDHGAGVPLEEREAIFLRGERGSGAAPGGSGLGLAIVAAIARAHGGTADVAAADGGGAVFSIVLPLAGRTAD